MLVRRVYRSAARQPGRWLAGARLLHTRIAYPGVEVHGRCTLEAGVVLTATDGSAVVLTDVVLKRGALVRADHGGRLSIGGGIVGCNSVIVAVEDIRIGADCWIAEMVVVRDQDHVRGSEGSIDPARFATSPITIGRGVWLCAGSTILKGVTIGDGATVAAGAVVTQDVPAGVIVGGVPARQIGRESRECPPL